MQASIIRETDAFAAGKLAAALHEAFLRVDPLMVCNTACYFVLSH